MLYFNLIFTCYDICLISHSQIFPNIVDNNSIFLERTKEGTTNTQQQQQQHIYSVMRPPTDTIHTLRERIVLRSLEMFDAEFIHIC